MATEERLITMSVQASADLSASQYCFMKIDTNGQLAVAGVDAAIAGVLQDAPAAISRAGNLAIGGRSKVVFGGTVAKGARVTSDSQGRAIAVGSGSAWSAGVTLDGGSVGVIGDVVIQIAGAEVSSLPA